MALVMLLRGVNVGGHRTFRPKQLAEDLGHLDVVNIGAAGTFVVHGRATSSQLKAEVKRRLPFAAEMMVFPGRDLTKLVARSPFAGHRERRDIMWFVSTLARKPRRAPRLPRVYPPTGTWQMRLQSRRGRFVCGMYRRHMKAIGYLDEVDRLYGMPATTRNWNTVLRIARALEA